MKRSFVSIMLASLLAVPALAQTIAPLAGNKNIPVAAPSQDYCISVMSTFPNQDLETRYQFFRLTEKMAVGATPEFQKALAHYSDKDVNLNVPVIKVIEAIANPVLRQAAPKMTVAYMGHLVGFSKQCETYIDGQMKSLLAHNPKLSNTDTVIAEDALYLRQILSDSLMRLEAHTNPLYSRSVNVYATSLVAMRDNIEFQAYARDIGDIEALYMTDLDGRLARSNDIINSEINRETLGDAVTLTKDMNNEMKRQDDRRTVETLLRILGRY